MVSLSWIRYSARARGGGEPDARRVWMGLRGLGEGNARQPRTEDMERILARSLVGDRIAGVPCLIHDLHSAGPERGLHSPVALPGEMPKVQWVRRSRPSKTASNAKASLIKR